MIVDRWSFLMSNFWTTLGEALLGFGFAIGIAVPFAVAITYSRVLELTIYPALVALNAVPKIAIAPLLVIWMGFGLGPKVVMVILICFFPIVISTTTGLKSDPGRARRALPLPAVVRPAGIRAVPVPVVAPLPLRRAEGGDHARRDRRGGRASSSARPRASAT